VEFGWGGVSQLARMISKSPSYVEKRLKLLKLSADVIESISAHEISPATAVELAALTNEKEQSRLGQLIKESKFSSRRVHELVKTYNEMNMHGDIREINTITDLDTKTQRVFDKAILILKLAILKITELIHTTEDIWIIYELMLQHNHMLDEQIDVLIREKKKLC
jgi:ParB family chromosome partitioning protein